MPLPDEQIEALVASILAVNSYGLDKAYAILPALREAGLTNPPQTAIKDIGELTVALGNAGYCRGWLTGMMAERLASLMAAIEGKLDDLGSFVDSNNKTSAINLLCTIKGIGSKVANDAWMLMKTK